MKNLGLLASLKSRRPRETVFEVPSEISYIRKASQKVLHALGRKRLNASILFDIRLCVEEAVRNAIVHGNELDKKLPVRIRYSFDDKRFEIVVEDKGRGFNYKKVPDPTTEKNIWRGGGRGVYLINYLMDEVEYSDKGNIIKMVKYL